MYRKTGSHTISSSRITHHTHMISIHRNKPSKSFHHNTSSTWVELSRATSGRVESRVNPVQPTGHKANADIKWSPSTHRVQRHTPRPVNESHLLYTQPPHMNTSVLRTSRTQPDYPGDSMSTSILHIQFIRSTHHFPHHISILYAFRSISTLHRMYQWM